MTYLNKLEEINKILKRLESTSHYNTQLLSDFFTEEQLLELNKFMVYSNTFVQSFNDYINLKNKSEKYEIERKKEIKKHDMNQNYLKRFY